MRPENDEAEDEARKCEVEAEGKNFTKIAFLQFGDGQTNKQTNRWTRPLHEAALSVASGGLITDDYITCNISHGYARMLFEWISYLDKERCFSMQQRQFESLHDVHNQLWTPADEKHNNNRQQHLDHLSNSH